MKRIVKISFSWTVINVLYNYNTLGLTNDLSNIMTTFFNNI